ncbi:hypothetical protein N0V82_001015 [Gnomoniopsis sp. IMI 355080]|nr:hypothetical protein N0V82_001015 [Gnomoniopsis sp. IMI 355080]
MPTTLPVKLKKSMTFIELLDSLVSSAKPFSLVELSGNLTLDIFSSGVMDRHFEARYTDHPSGFMSTYRELFHTYTHEQVDLPWYFTPRTEWRCRRLGKRIRSTLRPVIQEAFQNRQTDSVKSRNITSLSLKDINVLSLEAVDEIVDQLNTFMFAGHDTTSILISWMIYELSRTPQALQAVRDEMDGLFGVDHQPFDVRAKFLSLGDADCFKRMPYSSAVIKEALRLWPPAGTACMTIPGAGVKVKAPSGETYPLDGIQVYNCAIITQRDPAVYGDSANDFVPERWLPEKEEHIEIPVSAWRAFERGPRNCFGQELATLEARVVFAILSKHDSMKHDIGELSIDDGGRPIMNEHGES